jgi:transcriptional regulator with XRE-family HTH domain
MPSRKRRIRHGPIVRAFAEQLRRLRLARGLTQREVASRAHVTLSYISKLEAGGAAPGIDLLERLAQALEAGVVELLPSPAVRETEAVSRERLRQSFETLLDRAGPETLALLELFLTRLLQSAALRS